jgi:hypothetical protein
VKIDPTHAISVEKDINIKMTWISMLCYTVRRGLTFAISVKKDLHIKVS